MAKKKVLVINPNTTVSMTQGLEELISRSYNGANPFDCSYVTAPSGPASINNDDDAKESLEHCKPIFTHDVLVKYDAFVVACYSAHPLVPYLRQKLADEDRASTTTVLGILEASVICSMQLIKGEEHFGIVSTGSYWEKSGSLAHAVEDLRIDHTKERFAGVTTTGLTAKELHDYPPDEVKKKMMEATKRLLGNGKVGTICLGCAGMAGLDETVREACEEELGKSEGKDVHIVDGILSALEVLDQKYSDSVKSDAAATS